MTAYLLFWTFNELRGEKEGKKWQTPMAEYSSLEQWGRQHYMLSSHQTSRYSENTEAAREFSQIMLNLNEIWPAYLLSEVVF